MADKLMSFFSMKKVFLILLRWHFHTPSLWGLFNIVLFSGLNKPADLI